MMFYIMFDDCLGEWQIKNSKEKYISKSIKESDFLIPNRVDKNDKIAYLWDITIPDEKMIKYYLKFDFMKEIYKFIHLENNKEIASFQGTFIDALNYIKENFKGKNVK